MLRKIFLTLLFAPALLMGMPPITDGSGGTGGGTGGTGGGTGSTTPTLPAYDITTSPGYPWGPIPTLPGDTLLENQSLGVGQSLVSQNGAYRVLLQGDGNLVVYNGNLTVAYWDSATSGYWIGSSGRLTMQSDGNLVIYNSNNYPYWDIGQNTHFQPAMGRYGYYLKIQNDGNLVVYTRWGIDPSYFYQYYGYNLATWDCHYSQGNRH
ncbi:hypothetical protein [Geothrix rubra]|uniref:hypothetical protein n=1 Tax=Geothrix rubra TaxID=2927977 RepID=UPI00255557EA|nr:hypothetical protein [Geothrix rubra]